MFLFDDFHYEWKLMKKSYVVMKIVKQLTFVLLKINGVGFGNQSKNKSSEKYAKFFRIDFIEACFRNITTINLIKVLNFKNELT